MRHLGKTPPFHGPHGEVVSGSIAEIADRRLDGHDQWLMIRGESVANPPLILLHGGPGLSETGFFHHFNAPLEKSFAVVYWDQRGAGKSFDRNIPRSSMAVEQFISDLDELVDAVCKRLGKTKVAIFGHSWGSALGVLYAAHFPEKVATYVGSGQVGDWAAGESASYAFALVEAQRLGKRRAVKKLRAIGPPPHTAESLWTQRMWLSRLESRMGARAMWKLARAVLAGQESSIFDLPKTMRGFRFSLSATWTEVSRLNLIELVPALPMSPWTPISSRSTPPPGCALGPHRRPCGPRPIASSIVTASGSSWPPANRSQRRRSSARPSRRGCAEGRSPG